MCTMQDAGTMNNILPTAILFDLDDTILVTNVMADQIWEEVCKSFAKRLKPLDPNTLLDAIREQREWYWKDPHRHRLGRLRVSNARLDIVSGVFKRLGIQNLALAQQMADSHLTLSNNAMHPSKGSLETLQLLKDKGVRLSLVTNGSKETQRHKINRFGLEPFFDCILVEGEFGIGKPDERVYRHVLKQLNAQPKDTWMVGDNLEWEVIVPQRLGILGIWIDLFGKGLPPYSTAKPDRIIESLPERLS